MKTFKNCSLAAMVVCLMPALFSAPAWAALGKPAVSVREDGKFLKLEKSDAKSFASYRVEEWQSKDISIRQYVSNNGKVIGVAWRGNALQSVPRLLGSFANDYTNYESQHPRRAGRVPYRKVKAGNVVVETWDLLRKLEGRAYVPSMLPAGLTMEDLNMKKWTR